MTSIPGTMQAVIIDDSDGRRAVVKEHPVPAIADDEVLVKVAAVALNPTDWKHVSFPVGTPGTVLGCDFSGIVVKVGSAVAGADLAIGTHVAGFAHGGAFTDEGAFAEYVRAPAGLVWVVPEGTLSHEQAATFGCAFWTAVQALFHPTRLALAEPPQTAEAEEWILIYGGSSAVGQFAIQLAHLAGYKVATTCSPRNFALVEALGADYVVDYAAPDAAARLREAMGGGVSRALDTISIETAQKTTSDAFAPGGGKMVVLLMRFPNLELRKDVEVQPTLIYTACGRPFTSPWLTFAGEPEDRQHMEAFLKKVPQLVRDGSVKPLPVKLWEGGLSKISDGLAYMREGKVSAEKIVYCL